MSTNTHGARGSRRLIAVGALLTQVGLAIAATSPVLGTGGSGRTATQQLTGGLVVLAGWALLASGIHRFGRADPE
ncbi:MAG: hypothetical protein M3O50_03320 [Myxococcota bacterium]|nr:hypothetical protein [Myxococcota bacterium]